MIEGPDHTIGETRNDTSSTRPKVTGRSGSRQRAVSVVTLLRKSRSVTRSPAPPKPTEVTAAKKDRRKGKEQIRTAAKIAEEEEKKKEEEEKERVKKLKAYTWQNLTCDLEDELERKVKRAPKIERITKRMNMINDKWDIVGERVVERG